MNKKKKASRKAVLFIVAGISGVLAAYFYFAADSRQSESLDWLAPTQHLDESPLTDLAGYRVHCWNGEQGETISFDISDPAETHYEIGRLSSGHYQCAVSAMTIGGQVSALSNVVSRNVP